MKKSAIFYGSTTGNTQQVAETIAAQLGIASSEVFDVGRASADQLNQYDVLILGSSTWGAGDLQDDWEGFFSQFSSANLTGQSVAVFGTGDSSSYSYSFCDSIGILAKAARAAGAALVGASISTSDYSFDDSQAKDGEVFLGLPLDEDNESEKTGERITRWVAQIKQECGL